MPAEREKSPHQKNLDASENWERLAAQNDCLERVRDHENCENETSEEECRVSDGLTDNWKNEAYTRPGGRIALCLEFGRTW